MSSAASAKFMSKDNSALKDSMPRGGAHGNHLPVLSYSRIHPPSNVCYQQPNLRQKCRGKNKSAVWTTRHSSSRCCSGRHVRQTGLQECDQHGRSDGEKSSVITHAWKLLSLVLHVQALNFAKAKLVIAETSLFTYTRMSLRKTGCFPILV